MSNVRDLPPRILVEVATLLLSTNFDFKDPYDEFDDNQRFLEDSSKWASAEVDKLDVEFISKFIIENESILDNLEEDNNPNEIISELVIPKPSNYRIDYEVWGNATLTENYKTTWESYDESWAKESLRYSYNEGEFDYWQGEYIDHETDNFDNSNFEVTWVDKIKESKKTLLSKLVVENTSEVLKDLDRRTLIELRNLINQKLSSF